MKNNTFSLIAMKQHYKNIIAILNVMVHQFQIQNVTLHTIQMQCNLLLLCS